jgi:hypothetical protein
MNYDGLLLKFPREIKWFIATFVLVLSVGFYSGLLFVNETSTSKPSGIEENYLGNEADEDAPIMKFKKSEREMLTIVHTHVLSMSLIFFLMGILVWLLKLPKNLKLFLTIEPFISVLFTFGGIYLLWSGVLWFKYIVVFSGILMTISFIASSILVLYQLSMKPQ